MAQFDTVKLSLPHGTNVERLKNVKVLNIRENINGYCVEMHSSSFLGTLLNKSTYHLLIEKFAYYGVNLSLGAQILYCHPANDFTIKNPSEFLRDCSKISFTKYKLTEYELYKGKVNGLNYSSKKLKSGKSRTTYFTIYDRIKAGEKNTIRCEVKFLSFAKMRKGLGLEDKKIITLGDILFSTKEPVFEMLAYLEKNVSKSMTRTLNTNDYQLKLYSSHFQSLEWDWKLISQDMDLSGQSVYIKKKAKAYFAQLQSKRLNLNHEDIFNQLREPKPYTIKCRKDENFFLNALQATTVKTSRDSEQAKKELNTNKIGYDSQEIKQEIENINQMKTSGQITSIGKLIEGTTYRKQEFVLQTENRESITMVCYDKINSDKKSKVAMINRHKVGDFVSVLYNETQRDNYVSAIDNHIPQRIEPKIERVASPSIYQIDDSINFWIVGYNENGTPILNTGELDLVELGF